MISLRLFAILVWTLWCGFLIWLATGGSLTYTLVTVIIVGAVVTVSVHRGPEVKP